MEQSKNVELLTAWASPYAMAAKVALAYKGVEYKEIAEDLSRKSELLLKSNPVYKLVPVLLHDGRPVCESWNIMQYLDETWPSADGANLMPADAYGKATGRFWADYVAKHVFPPQVDALVATAKGQEEARKAAEDKLAAALTTIEEQAPRGGDGQFFGGAHMGVLDVALAPMLTWLPMTEELAHMSLPPMEARPRLQAALAAIRSHPAADVLPESGKLRDFLRDVLFPRFRQA